MNKYERARAAALLILPPNSHLRITNQDLFDDLCKKAEAAYNAELLKDENYNLLKEKS